jgi:hypothetical protein
LTSDEDTDEMETEKSLILGTDSDITRNQVFLCFEMYEECTEFLESSIGKTVCLSGRTQIRAGDTRSKVILV